MGSPDRKHLGWLFGSFVRSLVRSFVVCTGCFDMLLKHSGFVVVFVASFPPTDSSLDYLFRMRNWQRLQMKKNDSSQRNETDDCADVYQSHRQKMIGTFLTT